MEDMTPGSVPYELTYGLHITRTAEPHCRGHAARMEYGDIGALHENHYVLIVRHSVALEVEK